VSQPASPPGEPLADIPRPASRWAGLPRLRTLQAKFLAVVLPIVLVSTVVVFGFFEFASRRAAETQLGAKLDQTVEIQGAVLAESLWNVADQQIGLILAALLTDPDVVAAAVYDENGTAVALAGETEGMGDLPYFAEASIVYDYDGSNMQIGRLALALTDAKLAATALERMQLAGGLAATPSCPRVRPSSRSCGGRPSRAGFRMPKLTRTAGWNAKSNGTGAPTSPRSRRSPATVGSASATGAPRRAASSLCTPISPS
jgi:hypothetical protein